MQIVLEPRLILCTHEVAARFINVERWDPRDLVRDHAVENHHQAIVIRLAPQMAGITKAVDFVVVIVRGRKSLHPIPDGSVRYSIPVLDARRTEPYVVPCVRFGDPCMMRNTK